MGMIRRGGICFALAAVALTTAGGQPALSVEFKCEANKLTAAGKYDFCRLKAEADAVKTQSMPDFSRCDAAYSTKWGKAETQVGAMCPSSGDAGAVQAFITEHANALKAALDGGPLPEGVLSCNADLHTCGGNLNTCSANETACNANLSTCTASLAACVANGGVTLLKTGEYDTLYGAGSDGVLQKGISRSYTDNGDGTITDNRTGLMWEKKDESGGIHEARNFYTWSSAYGGFMMDGTITTTFLATLNSGGGFAGYTDWRIPNRFELESLIDLAIPTFTIDPIFYTNCQPGCTLMTCSCNMGGGYWSSTTFPYNGLPTHAWNVAFFTGIVYWEQKSDGLYVRAVRGGF